MKKYYFLILSLLISLNSFSQQPYYNGISTELTTETGMTLFNTLATLTINEHTNSLTYSNIWDASRITDEDPNNSSNVVLIYGWENGSDGDITNDLSRNKNSNGGNSGDWNREHTFANSLANPALDASGTSGPPYADAHNLRPCDVNRNSSRGNRLFSTGSGNSGQTGAYWYPGDASLGGTDWRGDVARIVMYMYLRYGSQCYPNLVANGTTNSIDSNMINLLLDWNAADPVSSVEDARNTYHDSSGTFAQGNRNPFIDEPYLATLIWGGTPAEDRWGIYGTDTQAPSVPTNLSVSNETSSSIDLNWTASTDNVGVTGYDIYVGGSYNSSSATNSHTVTGLSASTTYSFTVLAKDAANNMSAQSSAVDGTTTAGSSGGSELFISEYVEGSGNNKVLEIVNITGSTVDLSTYTIKKSINGSASWDTTIYSFPASAQIINNDVYVVANSSVASPCNITADDLTNSSVMQYNGNDPLGLFKNDVLIDIVGVLGAGSSNFAANTTLVRKSTITEPSTTFNIADWDSYAQDDCSNIGSHSTTLNVGQHTLFSEISMYPNPVNGNHLYFDTNRKLTISIYDILGKTLLTDTISINKKEVNISKLKNGTYFIKLFSEKNSITKKFIKN